MPNPTVAIDGNYHPIPVNLYDTVSGNLVLPQSGIPITDAAGNLYAPARVVTAGKSLVAATAVTGTASSNTTDIDVSQYRELALDINVTSFTGTNIAFFLQRKDAAGNYVAIYSPTALTTTGTVAQTIGVGAETNKGFGTIARIAWTCSAVTVLSFTPSLIGK
jgi:hypothetical protein